MTPERIILPEDPEAATLVTEQFWKARDGKYYLPKDQDLARWAGATHVHCEGCGRPVKKPYTSCDDCRNERERERWYNLDRKPWNGETPICIMGSDTYFFDEDDLSDYCEEHDIQPNDLLLMHCEPVKPRAIDIVDFLGDCLPEGDDGGSIPRSVDDAAKALNDALAAMKPLVWHEGKIAVDLEAAQ